MHNTFFYIIFLYGLFFILMGLLLWNLKEIVIFFKSLPKEALISLMLLLLMALYLRAFVIDHRVFYDEPVHVNVAQNMYYHHQYGVTWQGTKYVPQEIVFYDRPGGHCFLLNLGFLFSGGSEKSMFFISALLGTLSVGLIFLMAYVLFNSLFMAFFAGFFVNIFPVHLVYSGSASSEMSSFFCISLALFLFSICVRYPKMRLLYLLGVTVVLASYMRPENAFFLPFFLGFVFFLFYSKKLSTHEFSNLSLFCLILAAPLITSLMRMGEGEALKAKGHFWSINLLTAHLWENGKYLFKNTYMPFLYSIGAFLGMFSIYKISKKIFFGFALWFLTFFIAYSGHVAGTFWLSNRYFLICIIPLCVFAAAGVEFVLNRVSAKFRMLVMGVLIILFTFYSFRAVDAIYDRLLSSRNAQEYSFIKYFGQKLPDGVPVLTVEPYVVVAGMNKTVLSNTAFLRYGLFYNKLFLLKTVNWDEESFSKEEAWLKRFYDFKIIAQQEFFSNSRTFIAELTKKP